jgi:hypothetical protein
MSGKSPCIWEHLEQPCFDGHALELCAVNQRTAALLLQGVVWQDAHTAVAAALCAADLLRCGRLAARFMQLMAVQQVVSVNLVRAEPVSLNCYSRLATPLVLRAAGSAGACAGQCVRS